MIIFVDFVEMIFYEVSEKIKTIIEFLKDDKKSGRKTTGHENTAFKRVHAKQRLKDNTRLQMFV